MKRVVLAGSVAVFVTAFVASTPAVAQNKLPKHERIELRSFKSAALNETRSYVVYRPPGYSDAKRYPVVYLLHGLGGRAANWFDLKWGQIHRFLDQKIAAGQLRPVIAVAPNGGSGYWTNHLGRRTRRFGDYVAVDLVAHIDRTMPTIASADGRAVAGVSMGGHGALSLALMHPGTFGAAVSLSGALFERAPTHRKVYGRVWGRPPNTAHWKRTSPQELMKRLAAGAAAPAMYLHCGDRDGLNFAPMAQAASATLVSKAIPHTLRIVPGGVHSWRTWAPEAPKWLDWLEGVWKKRSKASPVDGDRPTLR